MFHASFGNRGECGPNRLMDAEREGGGRSRGGTQGVVAQAGQRNHARRPLRKRPEHLLFRLRSRAAMARRWTPGTAFVQDYFYWAELIEVLCGMRPSEIAQLRCRDIAPLSIEQQEEDRFDPQTGGILERRDAIVAAFIDRKVAELGGRQKFSKADRGH
jgi:hypothetical protein